MTPLLALVIPPALFVGAMIALLYALRGRDLAAPAPEADDAGDGDWFDQLRGAEPDPAPAPAATAAPAPAEAADIEDAAEAEAESPFDCGYEDGRNDALAEQANGSFQEAGEWTSEPEDDRERSYRLGFETGWNAEARRRAGAEAARPQPAPAVLHAPPAPAASFLGYPVRRERRLNPMITERQAARDTALRAVFAAGPITRAEAKAALRARGVRERMIKSWLESTSGRFTPPDADGRFTLAQP